LEWYFSAVDGYVRANQIPHDYFYRLFVDVLRVDAEVGALMNGEYHFWSRGVDQEVKYPE